MRIESYNLSRSLKCGTCEASHLTIWSQKKCYLNVICNSVCAVSFNCRQVIVSYQNSCCVFGKKISFSILLPVAVSYANFLQIPIPTNFLVFCTLSSPSCDAPVVLVGVFYKEFLRQERPIFTPYKLVRGEFEPYFLLDILGEKSLQYYIVFCPLHPFPQANLKFAVRVQQNFTLVENLYLNLALPFRSWDSTSDKFYCRAFSLC